VEYDVDMADPDHEPSAPLDLTASPAPLTPAAAANHHNYTTLAARLEELEDLLMQQLFEQTRWSEGLLEEPRHEVQELRDTIRRLENKVSDIEAHLGLQAGTQPSRMVLERAEADWEGMRAAEQVDAVAAPAAVAEYEDQTMELYGVSLAGALPIQIIPATPQDSQEMMQPTTMVAPPLPPLFTAMTLTERAAAPLASGLVPPASAVDIIASPRPSPRPPQLRQSPRLLTPVPQFSPSPRPSPPPAQLRRSPRGLTTGPSGLRSRSTTPQPNPKKRAGGTSEDRGETKRGRKA
jgi:hypothetical protein